MAKFKRLTVGSVVKGRDGKPDYIQMSQDVVLKKGEYLNLESKSSQMRSVESAIKDGKLSQEVGESILEKLGKIPDFVRFQIIKVEKQD